MPDFLVWPGLVLLGMMVGAYGTMIGAGGGFVLVPLLLLLYPDKSAELVTAISLGAVFFNAVSGSIAYFRQGRIDFVAGNAFALATVPGAIAGSFATGLLPRAVFDILFAILLVFVALTLILRSEQRIASRTHRRGEITRMLTDSHGDTYFYSYNIRIGIGLSIFIGFMASALGIGGGLVHVPMMIQLLHFPALIATATSQYVLVITSGTSAIVHLASGNYQGGYLITGALSLGVVAGAQFGAWLSSRLRGAVIVRFMAAALFVLAARLLMSFVL